MPGELLVVDPPRPRRVIISDPIEVQRSSLAEGLLCHDLVTELRKRTRPRARNRACRRGESFGDVSSTIRAMLSPSTGRRDPRRAWTCSVELR